MPAKKASALVKTAKPMARCGPLLGNVRNLILSAREQTARAVDSALVALYWHVGTRIHKEILKQKRAEYGEEIVAMLSQQLGWSHFKEIIPFNDSLQRDFYAEMCRINGWPVRLLRERIDSMRIVLCADASRRRIEILELAGRGIHIAKYLTQLPPRKLLEKRLKEAVKIARARFGDGALPVGKRLHK